VPVSSVGDQKLQKSKVLILGAGMAGIKAAKVLHSHGMEDFVFLEGGNRIGGRLRNAELKSRHSVNAGAQTVNQGGNWVAGTKGRRNISENPVWTLAKNCNLSTKVSDFDDNIYFIEETGKYVDESNPIVEETWEKLDAADSIIKRKAKRDKYPADVSLRDALTDAGWHPETTLDNCIEYYEYDSEYSATPSEMAARGSQDYSYYWRDPDKERIVVDERGFSYVIQYLAQTFLSVNEEGQINDTRLHLNTIVTDIDYSNDTITVTTAEGEVYVSDYVICTFSIGVLQRGNLIFRPPLPQQKTDAINNFQMAVYTNIFLKFDSKFWPYDNQNILFASEDRGYFTYHFNFASLFPKNPNWYVLLVTAEGDLSKQVESQTEEETVGQVMAVLRKMYGPDIPPPIDVVIPVWYNDPLFYGSFSYRPVNFTDEEYDYMRSSVNGRLYFAGEALDNLLYGYVQSAYFSGEETALCIMGIEGDEGTMKNCPGNLQTRAEQHL
jgi:polyamine oxidase